MKNEVNKKEISTLSVVSSHGGQHLTDAKLDLLQAETLLKSAAYQLIINFSSIKSILDRHAAIIEKLRTESSLSESLSDDIRNLYIESNNQIDSCVTHIQFQDLTSQLLDKSINRIDGVKEILDLLAKESCFQYHARNELEDDLNQVDEKLNECSKALNRNSNTSINQKDMTAGAIELF